MKSVYVVLGMALAVACYGQEITGSIVGTVTDPSGAGVPGAKITITNIDRNSVIRTTASDSNGNYVGAGLDVGRYSVSVEAKGFRKSTQTGISLSVNDRLTVNAKLEVGDVQQEITVESGAQQVALQSAEQSTVVNGTQIRELALITRNYEQLVSMMPGVSSASTDQLYVGVSLPSGATATVPFAINGARNSMNAWLVDGADNVDRGSNQTLLNTPSIDAIEEFKVQRSGYAAELGRAGGGQISVITRSGTKDFHGDVYEFVRNSAFAANNFFANATRQNLGPDGKANVAPLRYNNFGWTVGGPVIIPKVYNSAKRERHQTFFFFSQEFRRVITYATGTAILPTADEINGTFPHAICVQYTGSTCNQTSTSITNIDPVARQYIKDIFSKLPLGTTSNSLTSLFRNVYNFEQELYKFDHIFSPKLQLSVRYLRDSIPTTEPQGLFTGAPVPGVSITNTNAPGHNWTIRGTSTLTPTFLNEAGYNYSYGALTSDPVGLINSTISTDIKPTLPFPVTLNQVPGLVFLNVGTSITGFGQYRDYNRNHNVFDNATKILGSHTFKAGFTYNHYQKTENAAGANAGSFTFNPASVPAGATAYEQAFANFLLGNVASYSQASLDVTPDIRAQQWELYAQDDWRIMSNLTINIGVRYSMFRQPIDANNQLTNFSPAAFNKSNVPQMTAGGLLATIPSLSYLNGIITGGQNSPYGDKVSNESTGNVAPRFGFAWDPFKNGKTAIRGGYGIFYDATLYGTFEQNIFANPPFVNTVSIPNVSLGNPAGGTATVNNSPKILRGTPFDFQTPYTQQWSFEVQREVLRNTIVNVGYVGSKGTHLLGIVDLNSLPPGLAYTSGLLPASTSVTSANTPILNLLRPYPGYSSINQVVPWFNSNYHSLQVSAQTRFQTDSQFNLSYTWSKNLTDNQTDRSSAPQNVYNFHDGEYGPATFDRRHVFSANVIYTLPFMKTQHGLAGKVVGGWQVSAFANYSTGLPYTVTTTGVDPAALGILPGAASGRPDLTCDPYAGVTSTRTSWFNISCFPNVPAGVHRPGNEGRGVLRGPGYENWNVAASKNFLFRDRFRFQLRGEASNVLNHTNPSTFGSLTNTNSLFGTITGYRDPRIIQIAAKLYF